MSDEPKYLGLTILEVSKTFVCGFHYNTLQPFSDPNLESWMPSQYMDCDSILLGKKFDDSIQD